MTDCALCRKQMGPTSDRNSLDPRKRIQAEVGFGPNPKLARAHYACAMDYEHEMRTEEDYQRGDEIRQMREGNV